MSFGGGFRVSLGQKWGVDVEIEDVVRFGVDMSYLNGTLDRCEVLPPDDPANTDPNCGPGTPDPDPDSFRLYSTTWQGDASTVIHNFGFRFALTYSVWPFGAPR